MSDRVSIGGVDDIKMKGKIQETSSPTTGVELNLELTLRLGSNVLEYESSSNSSAFKSLSKTDNDEDSSVVVAPPPSTRTKNEEYYSGVNEDVMIEFRCEHCGKKFSCVNALNGHQNAHRRERNQFYLNKKRSIEMMMSATSSGSGLGGALSKCPYPASAPAPAPAAMVNQFTLFGTPKQPVVKMSAMPWGGYFGPNQELLHHPRVFMLGNQFGMASNNSMGASADPKILNHMNVGFGSGFKQYPSLAKDAAAGRTRLGWSRGGSFGSEAKP